ncbi:MAG: Peptidyl-tRNA hydrolase, partial [Planctomycetota bacterium]
AAAWKGRRLLLVKPTTFVNGSGEAAQAVLAFHKAAPADLLVLVDDLNLPLGDLRLRAEGSAGGHNGLRDIEARLGKAYPRLRLGIGRPRPDQDQIGFVLGRFAPEERADAEACATKAADAALAWAEAGVQVACRFNGPLRPPPPPAPKPRPAPPESGTPAGGHPAGPAAGSPAPG